MKNALFTVMLAGIPALLPLPVLADDAKIVWVDPSCNYFIAQLGDEYGVFQWRSGADPDEGDVVSGPLQDEGMLTVTNATKGGSNSVILVARGARLKPLINSSPVYCKKRWRSS